METDIKKVLKDLLRLEIERWEKYMKTRNKLMDLLIEQMEKN